MVGSLWHRYDKEAYFCRVWAGFGQDLVKVQAEFGLGFGQGFGERCGLGFWQGFRQGLGQGFV